MAEIGSTAILLFTRTAAEEASAKTFAPQIGTRGNQAIARQLIRHSHSIAKKSGYPVFTCTSDQQVGADFGHRFANAIENVFAQGYEKVIAIGNDCPDLTPEHIGHAGQLLATQSLVLGPSTDGGVYLLGIEKSAFAKDDFVRLPWESEFLQAGLANYAKQLDITPDWLLAQSDLDNVADFQQFLQSSTPVTPLFSQLKSIVASFSGWKTDYSPAFLSGTKPGSVSLRAPPF